jgi:hypothetical protein
MTILIQQLPAAVDRALSEKATREGRSVQEVAVEAIAKGLGIESTADREKLDLSKFVGTWVEDPEFDEAMKDFERIDPELWK